jgi:hypothetical protein
MFIVVNPVQCMNTQMRGAIEGYNPWPRPMCPGCLHGSTLPPITQLAYGENRPLPPFIFIGHVWST